MKILFSILFAFHVFGSESAFAQRDRLPPHQLLPDLVVTEITEPQVTANGGFLVQVTVRNIGRVFSGGSNLLFLDNNNTTNQLRAIPALSARQSTTISLIVSPPENQGPWYFSAIADYGNRIREANENNNVRNFYQ